MTVEPVEVVCPALVGEEPSFGMRFLKLLEI